MFYLNRLALKFTKLLFCGIMYLYEGGNGMKFIKKILLSIFITICSLTFIQISVSDSPASSIVEASSIRLNKTKYTLFVGKTFKLKIKGTNKKVKWSTNNKKISTVSSNGKVTAKKEGTCTITAKVNGKKYTCKITVKKALQIQSI